MRKNILAGVSKERISEIMAKRPKDMNSEELRIYKRVLFDEWNGRNRKHARRSFDDFKKWSNDFIKYGHPGNHFVFEKQEIQVATAEDPENENISEISVKPEYNWRSNNIKKVIKQIESIIDDEDLVNSFNDEVKDLNNINDVIKIAGNYVEVKDLRQKKNIEESSVSTEIESEVPEHIDESVAL